MGNTVTCCVSPDASPKLSRARGGGAAPGPDRWADAYQAAAAAAAGGGGGSGSAEAESGDSDPGGGGPHLQHISDREFPDGERGTSGGARRAGGRAAGSAGHRVAVPPVPSSYTWSTGVTQTCSAMHLLPFQTCLGRACRFVLQ
uniref:Uncharacterized protein n=1 Tax=Accipiter nisus TaxID=211598 RepID=A0A8B9MAR2_9AVES